MSAWLIVVRSQQIQRHMEAVHLHTLALQIGTHFLLTLETIVFLFDLLSATSKPFSSLSTRLAHAVGLGFFYKTHYINALLLLLLLLLLHLSHPRCVIIITFANVVVSSWFVSQQDNSRSCRREFWWNFLEGGVCDWHQTIRFWWWSGLQCGSGKELLQLCDWGNCTNFADNSKSCHRIFVKFFVAVWCLTHSKPLSFAIDPDHNTEPEIFNGIFCQGITYHGRGFAFSVCF